MNAKHHLRTIFGTVTVLAAAMTLAAGAWGQAGFPGSLRRYSDNKTVPFRIGTAVILTGTQSLYPVNGYLPGLLTASTRDRAYQAIIQGQFNQIEPGNEMKMMSLWTGGVALVNGHYVAKTNLYGANGPLMQSCAWAEAQRPRLTVRGHCMVYYQDYTLPTFPADQPALFIRDSAGKRTLNPVYKPSDLRDMLESYVQQVVDATMAQNAQSRERYGYKVMAMWDVTNEVVSEDAKDADLPGLGFAYRANDPWHNAGPAGSEASAGYDYVNDIYRWAAQEMKKNIGKTLAGRNITAADKFELYYNEYNLEWSPSKMTRVLNMIRHIRQGGGEVDGLGFQTHIQANGLNTKQFETNINAAIAAGLRFSVTEADCTINETPKTGEPSVAEQEVNQGREYGEVVGLCLAHQSACDAFQIWGATDDGSWLQNREATPVTRWVTDMRPGPTKGKVGYWPKEGQYDPETLCDPATGALDPKSGHNISNAYDQILAALKTP